MANVNVNEEGFAQPWVEFEKQIGARLQLRGPIEQIPKQSEAIGALLMAKLSFPAGDATVRTEDMEVARGGSRVTVRVYTPAGYAGGRPACVFFHGGGWAMGGLDDEDVQLRRIATDAGVVIVSVDYRLAPAHPYPAPLDDCVAAYHWALENAALLNTAEGEAFVFGTSAGANLALGTALRLIDAGEAGTLKGVVAVVPVTVAPEVVPEWLRSKYTSYTENTTNTINTYEGMRTFIDAYTSDPSDPYISPLLHKRIKDLPKTYISVCTQDTLRDDGRLFKAALDDAGVPNLYDEYTGYPHWFWAYPSEHLVEPIALYHKNIKKAFEFVTS